MAKTLKLFALLFLFSLALPSAYGDELEGLYQDGPWTVTIRQRADGSYDVERSGKVAGKQVTQKSVAKLENGRLLAEFQGEEIQSRSMSNQLGEVSGGSAKTDITIKPFELLARNAAARRVADLPKQETEQASAPTPTETIPAIVNQNLGNDPTAPPTAQTTPN
ncbi:MAG: hypothetical protein P1V97_27640, partial [Planctomycetota bacterium]|nr:hypothetical protein [Planctomycetota bacterium]